MTEIKLPIIPFGKVGAAKLRELRQEFVELGLVEPSTKNDMIRIVCYLRRGNSGKSSQRTPADRLEVLKNLQKKWVGYEKNMFGRNAQVINVLPKSGREIEAERTFIVTLSADLDFHPSHFLAVCAYTDGKSPVQGRFGLGNFTFDEKH